MALPSSLPPIFLSTFFLCYALIIFSTRTEAQGTGISSLVSEGLFKEVFPNMDNISCPAKGFYSYEAFINAAKRYPEFGTTGSDRTRKREIAAFFAQISHQSASGDTNASAPYTWGLCLKEQPYDEYGGEYCDYSFDFRWDCSVTGYYNGRGPMMIRWNFNYGPAGMDLGLGYDFTWNPEKLLSSSKLAFETALWVWMTERWSYPSPHNVMVGKYKPTAVDLAANWTAGFGLTTNIIGVSTVDDECGQPRDKRVRNRINYYKRIARLFNVTTGPHLDCGSQQLMKMVPYQFDYAPEPYHG